VSVKAENLKFDFGSQNSTLTGGADVFPISTSGERGYNGR
jgi:hypothetical protein